MTSWASENRSQREKERRSVYTRRLNFGKVILARERCGSRSLSQTDDESIDIVDEYVEESSKASPTMGKDACDHTKVSLSFKQ